MTKLSPLLEIREDIDDGEGVFEGSSGRMEQNCIEILCSEILQTLGETLTNLIFKRGVHIIRNVIPILTSRKGEFCLQEEVFAIDSGGSSNGITNEMFAVMSWLASS